MPAGYLPLYEDVETATEDAGYALIDDISEWLLGSVGSEAAVGGPENSTNLAVTGANGTLAWLEALNSTQPAQSNSSAEDGERGVTRCAALWNNSWRAEGQQERATAAMLASR